MSLFRSIALNAFMSFNNPDQLGNTHHISFAFSFERRTPPGDINEPIPGKK